MAKTPPLILTGKCYWASVVEPRAMFEPAWQVDLCLDEDTKPLVQEAGLKIRNKGDERGEFITLKRKVYGRNGLRKPVIVVDKQNNPWNKEKLITNGSLLTIKALPFEGKYAGKYSKGADLREVTVIELFKNEGE